MLFFANSEKMFAARAIFLRLIRPTDFFAVFAAFAAWRYLILYFV